MNKQWTNIRWVQIEKEVLILQQQIVDATKQNNTKQIIKLQMLLVNSCKSLNSLKTDYSLRTN
jgi:N-terminal domain of reverse transcriptase